MKFEQKRERQGLNDFLPSSKTKRIGLNSIMPHHSKVYSILPQYIWKSMFNTNTLLVIKDKEK